MADTLTNIREGLAANLAVLKTAGLVDNISLYELTPTPPVIWVKPDPGEFVTYHQAMRNGLEYWHFVIEAYVGTMFDIGAQMKLDALATGTPSVRSAIETDKTLGGIALDVKCENAHGYSSYAKPDGTGLHGCKWDVTVHMQGG